MGMMPYEPRSPVGGQKPLEDAGEEEILPRGLQKEPILPTSGFQTLDSRVNYCCFQAIRFWSFVTTV